MAISSLGADTAQEDTSQLTAEQLLRPAEAAMEAAVELSGLMPQPHWVQFFQEIIGTDGIIRQLFPAPQERFDFEKSEEYMEILTMLFQLRERSAGDRRGTVIKTLTPRVPKALSQSLAREAHDMGISKNQLYLIKLLQPVSRDVVFSSQGDRRAAA